MKDDQYNEVVHFLYHLKLKSLSQLFLDHPKNHNVKKTTESFLNIVLER